MAKAKRKLSKVDVQFISLVNAGANNKTIIWKSAAETKDAPTIDKDIPILKVDEDKRLVYGIVYSPDEVDSQGDTMSGGDIIEMSYNFMKSERNTQIDKDHNEKPNEGFVAESWIVKGGDSVFPKEKTGSWAVGIKVESNETWKLVKSGKISGLSI